MGRTAGFDFLENTLWPSHTRGPSNAGFIVNGAGQSGATLTVSTGTGIPVAGDVITITGVFRVHPETKQSTGQPQPFVIGAGATLTSFPISPAIVTTGALQNVSGSPANAAAVTIAGTLNVPHGISMAYQKGAFAFATADMMMPNGVDFASREVFDGVSMRIVRQYDINSDKFPCRLDVLYGFKTIRPQLACRLANN